MSDGRRILDSYEATEIVADEILQHWHSSYAGKCSCGGWVGRSPQDISRHVAEFITDRLRKAQDGLD